MCEYITLRSNRGDHEFKIFPNDEFVVELKKLLLEHPEGEKHWFYWKHGMGLEKEYPILGLQFGTKNIYINRYYW